MKNKIFLAFHQHFLMIFNKPKITFIILTTQDQHSPRSIFKTLLDFKINLLFDTQTQSAYLAAS